MPAFHFVSLRMTVCSSTCAASLAGVGLEHLLCTDSAVGTECKGPAEFPSSLSG